MTDIIRLLPDNVANQIAAGEVIQRPASAVKELLENSLDAGATEIRLIIKDAGKTLIQVIDNGSGMSVMDARMSLERHATSKISKADDLFAIRTMGFRGEALPSIAAISMLEMKTRLHDSELATLLEVEGSIVKNQYPVAAPAGTSISIKNLFFNVPARRSFLKSDRIESNHILEEFIRVAIASPSVRFEYYDDSTLKYKLEIGNLKQRLVAIFGENYKERLLPVEQKTDIANISGYIVKPEYCRKSRGEQYFYVNKRYIRHSYLNHAAQTAYEELISSDTYPGYFIFFEIDPTRIDINIHPTKTEVNFLDNQHLYAFLRSSVKKTLGMFSIGPSLDFDTEPAFNFNHPSDKAPVQPHIQINPDYNPFDARTNRPQAGTSQRKTEPLPNWKSLYDEIKKVESISYAELPLTHIDSEKENPVEVTTSLLFILGRYIASPVKSGLMLIDVFRARERIVHDQILAGFENQNNPIQQQMFPLTIDFQPTDIETLNEILPELSLLGFSLENFGTNSFIVRGMPTKLADENARNLIERILQNYKSGLLEVKLDRRAMLARSISKSVSYKSNKPLELREMEEIIEALFRCNAPEVSPTGKPVIRIVAQDDLETMFA